MKLNERNLSEMRASDTDRVEIDNEQSEWKGNDVLRLDVEVGNTVSMKKSDTLYQLATEIHNVVAKHPACERALYIHFKRLK